MHYLIIFTRTLAVFFTLSISHLLYADNYLQQRFTQEQQAYESGFVLIPHKNNYVLPLTYMHKADSSNNPGASYPLRHVETKFQISVKILLSKKPVFGENGLLFFAYTNTSVWQSYNRSNSSPFRDSNHNPELFMMFDTQWQWHDIALAFITPGIEHQSNGQHGTRSRSWNRIYLNNTFSYRDWVINFKPWYRIPERKKRNPQDAKGDDNPDILHFYGYYELHIAKNFAKHQVSMMLRNNLQNENRGAIEINYSYPINSHLKGYVQLFHGYGEMLLDYNVRNTRIGFGIMFNNGL